jgi:hypothetical protein
MLWSTLVHRSATMLQWMPAYWILRSSAHFMLPCPVQKCRNAPRPGWAELPKQWRSTTGNMGDDKTMDPERHRGLLSCQQVMVTVVSIISPSITGQALCPTRPLGRVPSSFQSNGKWGLGEVIHLAETQAPLRSAAEFRCIALKNGHLSTPSRSSGPCPYPVCTSSPRRRLSPCRHVV